MKRIQYICIAGLLSLMAVSCKKALEEKAFSFISPDQFYKSGADAQVAINAVYNELYTFDLYMQPLWNLTLLDDDHVSGADWYLGAAGAGNPQSYWGVDRPWNGFYTIISRANTVLEKVPGITQDIDPNLKQRVLGEAHFFRGWAYFYLVQMYGGVPLRMQSFAMNSESNIPRATVKATYDTVIAELKAAEQLLFPAGDSRSGDAGRVTKGVAQGFLAKAYLTMASGALSGASIKVRGGKDNGYYTYAKKVVAGHEEINAAQYFKLARDKALEIIQSNNYSLFDNWIDIWKKENRNRKEHMWELQSLYGTSFVNDLHAYFSARSPFGTGAVWMSNDHYRNFDTTDTRIVDGVTHQYQANWGAYKYYPSWQQYKYGTDASGRVYNNDGKEDGDNKAFVNKFSFVEGFNNDQLGQSVANNQIIGNSDAFFPLLRYAEVLVMLAEAENEVNGGPTTAAYDQLNAIRRRAKAPDAPAGMNQQDFRSYVLEERGREFSLEGIRRFDLIRWGIYLDVMNAITVNQNNISKVRLPRTVLFPIPQAELNANKAITANNAGW